MTKGDFQTMESLVEFKNELNTVRFNGFNAIDQDIFLAFCAQMKNKQSEIIEFSFNEVREILDYPKTLSNAQMIKALETMSKRMLELTCNFVANSKHVAFVLFPTFVIDTALQTLKVRVNPDFSFLLNDFSKGGYTQLELRDFMSLNSKYSKTLYRYLKQFRSTGMWKVTYDDFREIFCVPQSYKPRNVSQKILTPALEELKKFYNDLVCTPYYLSKPGAPLAGYVFTFQADDNIVGQMTFNVQPQKQKQKQKNRFNNFPQREYPKDFFENLFNK